MMAMREKLEALNAFDIKTMWAVLSLQVTLDPGELDAMRQTFKDSWTRRTEVLAKTNDDTDWGAVEDQLTGMKKDLDGKIKLTAFESLIACRRCLTRDTMPSR
jgi:hypothetical protein